MSPLNAVKGLLLKLKAGLPKERIVFGVDAGTHSVKYIKLRLSEERAEVLGFGIEPAQADLAAVLRKIMQESGAKKANISVSGPSAVIRYANFPRMSQQELQQSLKFEAQKHIPFSISEVNFDANILKSGLSDNKMLVLLAAVKKDSLGQRLKYFEDSGLQVNSVDMDAVALANAFAFNYPQDEALKTKSIGLLNVGASFSNLTILESGVPRLSRDIQVAGNNLTQKISEELELDFKSAEAFKLRPQKEKAEKFSSVLESVLSGLAAEVRTSFDYYESQSTTSVVKIFLSGGSSLSPGFKDTLANLLGIEVGYWDPFNAAAISGDMNAEGLKGLSTQLAVAMGLALRS